MTETLVRPRPWVLRDWQERALPRALMALAQGQRGVISAVMGAGKSILLAEVVAAAVERGWGPVVVSTPTVALVDQLAETLSRRVTPVGKWYTRAKDAQYVTVVCYPSLRDYARATGTSPGLWIADECHRTETVSVHDAHKSLQPLRALGLSATPYRSPEDEYLSLWEVELLRYTPTNAIRDGVLVPPRIRPWDDACRSVYGDQTLDDACILMILDECRRGDIGPGVVSAATIADAEIMARKLTDAGMRVDAIHSRLTCRERQSMLARLEAGRLDALVHVALLVEGVDLPWLRWICLRRPRSRVGLIQEVGRVLRAHPGKTEALVLDPLDQLGGVVGLAAAALGWSLSEGDVPDYLREAAEAVGVSPEDYDSVDGLRAAVADLAGEALRRRSPVLVPSVASWLVAVLAALSQHDLAPEPVVRAGSWRHRPPTPKQCATLSAAWVGKRLRGLYGRHPVYPALRAALSLLSSGRGTRGAASDMLTLLIGVHKHLQVQYGVRYPRVPEQTPLPPPPPLLSLAVATAEPGGD